MGTVVSTVVLDPVVAATVELKSTGTATFMVRPVKVATVVLVTVLG